MTTALSLGLNKTRLFLILLLASAASHAEMPVNYVLAPKVLVSDPAPNSRFDPLTSGDDFRSRFRAAFPGRVIVLSPDRMISPDERVILIVPSLTAVRIAHTVQAGVVHTFDTVIVGDVSAIDPWTRANLFSATRMVSGEVQIGQSMLAGADAKIRDGFRDAYGRWIDVSIRELQQKLAPFVLDASTVSVPEQMRNAPGGIWPYGSLRGLKAGATLTGTGGHFARVTHVAARFADIEDVADSKREIQAGEHYTFTAVEKPADRPEPRVASSWIGAPPRTPEGLEVLDANAMLGLFNDYMSKGGGFRILPPAQDNTTVRGQIQELIEEVARYSKLVSSGIMTRHEEEIAQSALEAPESRIDFGVVERYHGQREGPNGSIEHYYRITLAAAVYFRSGPKEYALYPIQRVIRHSEELAEVTREGVRDIDPAAAWFTVTRNAVIRLSAKILNEFASVKPGAESAWRQGVVSTNGSIAWAGGAPAPGSPIEWLRPYGEIRNQAGESLGQFERLMVPSKGFLNAQTLQGERLQTGDVLRYQAEGLMPILGLGLESSSPAPERMPEATWQLRLAADTLSRAFDIRVVPLDNLDQPVNNQIERAFILNAQALKADATQDGAVFGGQWRIRLVNARQGVQSPPLFKTGIQNDSRTTREAGRPPLVPSDLSGWTLRYLEECFKRLADLAISKGVKAAARAPRSEVTQN
jgi:hypothetical protein